MGLGCSVGQVGGEHGAGGQCGAGGRGAWGWEAVWGRWAGCKALGRSTGQVKRGAEGWLMAVRGADVREATCYMRTVRLEVHGQRTLCMAENIHRTGSDMHAYRMLLPWLKPHARSSSQHSPCAFTIMARPAGNICGTLSLTVLDSCICGWAVAVIRRITLRMPRNKSPRDNLSRGKSLRRSHFRGCYISH